MLVPSGFGKGENKILYCYARASAIDGQNEAPRLLWSILILLQWTLSMVKLDVIFSMVSILHI